MTVSDKTRLIRMAADLPKGDEKRRAILTGLKMAMEHASPEALKQYLKDHPGADKSKHTVSKGGDKGDGKKDDSPASLLNGIDGRGPTKAVQDALADIKKNGIGPGTAKAVGKALSSLTRETASTRQRLEEMRYLARKNPENWNDNIKSSEKFLQRLYQAEDVLKDFKAALQTQEKARQKGMSKEERAKEKADKADAKAKAKAEKESKAEAEKARLEGSTPQETKANKSADKLLKRFEEYPSNLSSGSENRKLFQQVAKASPKMRDEIIKKTEERAKLYKDALKRPDLNDATKKFWGEVAVMQAATAKIMKGEDSDWTLDDPGAGDLKFLDPVRHKALMKAEKAKAKAEKKDGEKKKAFVIDNVASDRSTLIRMAADLPKGDEKRRAILAGLSKTALEVDKYVAINMRGKEEMVVAVVGIDSRVIQSGETYLKAALKKLEVDVADRNPVKVPLPDDDEWGWMGFTVYGEPEALAEAMKALKKEAKKLHMKVHEGRGRWPKPPRVY